MDADLDTSSRCTLRRALLQRRTWPMNAPCTYGALVHGDLVRIVAYLRGLLQCRFCLVVTRRREALFMVPDWGSKPGR